MMRLVPAILFLIISVQSTQGLDIDLDIQVNKGDKEVSFTGKDTSVTGITFHTKRNEDVSSISLLFGNKTVHCSIDDSVKRIELTAEVTSSHLVTSLSSNDRARLFLLSETIIATTQFATLKKTDRRLSDVFLGVLHLLSKAPTDYVMNITIGSTDVQGTYTSICNEIGSTGTAQFTVNDTVYQEGVTVGPVCYTPPALGRCGAGGGPDPWAGMMQRFTQECLNHDQCCVVNSDGEERLPITGNSDGYMAVNICGKDCADEFAAAIFGFLYAHDCATTDGNWEFISGFPGMRLDITGGVSSGDPEYFDGDVTESIQNDPCTDFLANAIIRNGMRTGQDVYYELLQPESCDYDEVYSCCNQPDGVCCYTKFSFTGKFSDCNVAAGEVTNPMNAIWPWDWRRDVANKEKKYIQKEISSSFFGFRKTQN
eukprot:CAMPEP_0185024710 /NCGR_PEP_ID=MMETSP1103-20130426/7888_1 /TAXON_ID=36769 /ORGANISM="Paraphysomonas bandaiensis, Strain Caron Lab Isolate" /LENGTH=425 /DNA_ID=CAMNT_0027557747 /DNA_START=14 /DNA_END=1291 /DNA_ORIENTATION=+